MRILEFPSIRQQTGEKVRNLSFEDWISREFDKQAVRYCKYNDKLDYRYLVQCMQYVAEIEFSKAMGEEITTEQADRLAKIDTLLSNAKNGRCFVVGEKLDRYGTVSKTNMDYRELIPIDIDNATYTFEELKEMCEALGCNYLLHTTFKHTKSHPRYRVLIPTDNKIYTEWQYLAEIEKLMKEHFPKVKPDNMGKRWAQKMYYPMILPGGEEHYQVAYRTDLPYYHVDKIERSEADYKILDQQRKTHAARVRTGDKSLQTLGDPAKKSGWIGAVCGAYNIIEAFEQIPELKNHYVRVTEDRYRYDKDGTGLKHDNPGVIVDDGTKCVTPWSWALSYHNNDPMCDGHWHNLYDIWYGIWRKEQQEMGYPSSEQDFNNWLAEGNAPAVLDEYERRREAYIENMRKEEQLMQDFEYNFMNNPTPDTNFAAQVATTPEGKRRETSDPGRKSIFVARDRKKFHDRIMNPENAGRISTGIPILDEKLDGGFRKGLIVIGAEPSCGKSTLSLQIADHIARTRPVLYVSLEMDADSLYKKSISRLSREMNPHDRNLWLTFDEIEQHVPDLNRAKFEAYANAENTYFGLQMVMADQNAFIDDVELVKAGATGSGITRLPDLSAKGIEHAAHKIKEITGQAPVVFIDYLQLMDMTSVSELGKEIRLMIDDNIVYLKNRIAAELDTPVIVISSLNRESYNRKRDKDGNLRHYRGLSMTSLRESGGVEFTAELIIMMSHYDQNGENQVDEKILLEIPKNRFGKKSVYRGEVDIDSLGPNKEPRLEGGFLLKFDKDHSYFRAEEQI